MLRYLNGEWIGTLATNMMVGGVMLFLGSLLLGPMVYYGRMWLVYWQVIG